MREDNPHDDPLFNGLHFKLYCVGDSGARFFQCSHCGRFFSQREVGSITPMSRITMIWHLPTIDQEPAQARTPVPNAFYKAFEGDDESGVKA